MICQLSPDIYRLQIPFSNIYTCIFLIRTPEGMVVYDTGTYSTDIPNYLVPALKELNMQPCAVVVSHNHGDHAGGLAAFHELFPETPIYAGSEACKDRVNTNVHVLTDGIALTSVLKVVHIPGHTVDAVGLYDVRTKALISGDCLQACGIYGKGKWGTSIPYPQEHWAALNRLEDMDIHAIYAAHDYEPYGNCAIGNEAVKNYILKCAQALRDIEVYAQLNAGKSPDELAECYAEEKSLPIPPAKTFAPFS